MRQYLKYFAIAADQAGATKHFSGPHASREVARDSLKAALTDLAAKGVDLASAGIFAADFEAAAIPPPAVKADSNEAS